MNPSRFFIERPVATTLLMVAILLSGALAYRLLPQAALPEVDYPTIQVATFYPGASPDVMAASVTAPLERQLGSMPGLVQMSSRSSAGASVITLQFALALSLDVAEQSVQAAINGAASFMPPDLPAPPLYSKVNPADAPILTLAVTSETLSLTTVQDLVDTRLAQRISQVPGVGLVTLAGGQRRAVRIDADAGALASYGIGLDELRAAIGAAGSNQAKGGFDGPDVASSIEVDRQLRTPAEFADLIVASRAGAPVRLGAVAAVTEGAEDARLAAWAGERPAILVNVQRQPGANVIRVVDRVRALLPELAGGLPAAVEVSVLTDRTESIRGSVRDVQHELVMAVGLVVAVIFLFLRSPSATLIPSLAVPLSLVGTFGVMYLAGFSVNNLTLMALTVATGFVVDDAVVMIENIARHIEEGAPPMRAALEGSRQIGFTIISLTFSLLAVLIPLLFMGDVVGRLFREFAVTLAVSIIISAFVSLSFTPMLCAHLLGRGRAAAEAKGGALAWVIERYGVALRWVLARRRGALAAALATLLLTVGLAAFIPKGFFPQQDTGVIQAIAEAPQTISFRAMAERQQALGRVILRDPAVASLSSIVGVDGVNAALSSGRMLINLKPHAQRQATAAEIARRLEVSAREVPGITLFAQPIQELTVDDRVSRAQYQVLVESPDATALDEWVPRLLERLRALPEVRNVASDHEAAGLKAAVQVDRDVAARLGVTMAAIDDALHSAFGPRIVSTIFTQTNQYRVVLQAAAGAASGPAAIEGIHVRGAGGRQVPLGSIARISEVPARQILHREKQFPSATLSFDLAPGYALGQAVAAIEAERDALAPPPSVQARFQGAALAFRAALANEVLLIIAALATMYIVLGVLYESFVHPLTILSTLPSAGVGALLALLLTGNDLGVIAVIGIVLLIGIVQKNAIMIIDFALDAERTQGRSPGEAIYEACLLRFRPIAMTTLAALLSAVPLVLGAGPGSELRRPLGIALIGGLIFSQALTLFTTPVIYLAFGQAARALAARRAASLAEGAAAP